jgi:hypothetical protein
VLPSKVFKKCSSRLEAGADMEVDDYLSNKPDNFVDDPEKFTG